MTTVNYKSKESKELLTIIHCTCAGPILKHFIPMASKTNIWTNAENKNQNLGIFTRFKSDMCLVII